MKWKSRGAGGGDSKKSGESNGDDSKKGGESNGDDSKKGGGDVPLSVHLDMTEYRVDGSNGRSWLGTGGGSTSFYEPSREQTPGSGSGHDRSGTTPSSGRDPPEKRLTLFALRLAVLEKAASGLGKLAFAWATVVLLGGFASSLRIRDFWFVTIILVGEGARVFSRSHELEWQQHATSTSTAGSALRSSSRFFRHIVHAIRDPAGAAAGDGRAAQFQRQVVAFVKQRTWHAPEVSLLPYTGWVFVSRKIGRLLNLLQLLSALTCVALSLMRLWTNHDFGDESVEEKKNMRPALLLFYALAFLEATLFLMEKAYWSWKMSARNLLHKVSSDCGLGEYGHVSLTRFFYDAYSRCIAGSIFDGIKMDLVTFAEDLILSDFLDEQLIGVRILQSFVASDRSARDTLRKVGTSHRSVERLVEMLDWKRADEEEVRKCAAEVVSRLASKRQNVLRVSGIPGAIESVMSLLYTGRNDAPPVSGTHPQQLQLREHEASPSPATNSGYEYLPFNLLGLQILKRLARDQDNCGKMGNARGLLAKIIDFTHASPELLGNPYASELQIRAVKRALRLVKMLVYATGQTGKALRREVAENVFSVSNLRGILKHGQQHRHLQKLATDVLTGLAMDEKGTAAIVGTGGVVKLLLSLFLASEPPPEEETIDLGCEAGEALAMLALESGKGCAAILKRSDVIDRLVEALQDKRRLNAARVLRNLCAYSGTEHRERLLVAGITKALPSVLKATMTESDKVLEVSIGLTTEICTFIDGDRFAAELRAAGIENRAYVERLASVLKQYRSAPEISVPRMRRFVVQQLIWLVTTSPGGYVEMLKEVGMERLLENVADTTSELECYHVFSGSVGIGKHREDFAEIVESAMELLLSSGGAAGAQE
ncbi:hypothetical protein PR202_ga25677 [Eleusine coracana subsp. coracana]|uniref:ARM repeat superfamily protein n=1 Tax=Eleusine coracana subsp. coracana TaxID=191504 RepID=A0AAV5D9Y2_ELECO|nr:hypothetical protein QOZ80_3AG0249150 [Eleusine coracana subsp. coracana]GJN07813.1 hypothetical protein PR202_ga25677 [Eleusine coracana subsp. coracana]